MMTEQQTRDTNLSTLLYSQLLHKLHHITREWCRDYKPVISTGFYQLIITGKFYSYRKSLDNF